MPTCPATASGRSTWSGCCTTPSSARPGLTIHDRGIDALLRFMEARAHLFRAVYFHRTVRAIDLTLADLFAQSKRHLFPGNPAELLPQYQQFTEASLLVDVSRWAQDADAEKRTLAAAWQQFLQRQIPWTMVCQRNLEFAEDDAERSSIFSDAEFVERKLRQQLPAGLADIAAAGRHRRGPCSVRTPAGRRPGRTSCTIPHAIRSGR